MTSDTPLLRGGVVHYSDLLKRVECPQTLPFSLRLTFMHITVRPAISRGLDDPAKAGNKT
jgi:hypothetical protein